MNRKEIFTTILIVRYASHTFSTFSGIDICIKMKELQVNNRVATNNEVQCGLVGSSFLSWSLIQVKSSVSLPAIIPVLLTSQWLWLCNSCCILCLHLDFSQEGKLTDTSSCTCVQAVGLENCTAKTKPPHFIGMNKRQWSSYLVN